MSGNRNRGRRKTFHDEPKDTFLSQGFLRSNALLPARTIGKTIKERPVIVPHIKIKSELLDAAEVTTSSAKEFYDSAHVAQSDKPLEGSSSMLNIEECGEKPSMKNPFSENATEEDSLEVARWGNRSSAPLFPTCSSHVEPVEEIEMDSDSWGNNGNIIFPSTPLKSSKYLPHTSDLPSGTIELVNEGRICLQNARGSERCDKPLPNASAGPTMESPHSMPQPLLIKNMEGIGDISEGSPFIDPNNSDTFEMSVCNQSLRSEIQFQIEPHGPVINSSFEKMVHISNEDTNSSLMTVSSEKSVALPTSSNVQNHQWPTEKSTDVAISEEQRYCAEYQSPNSSFQGETELLADYEKNPSLKKVVHETSANKRSADDTLCESLQQVNKKIKTEPVHPESLEIPPVASEKEVESNYEIPSQTTVDTCIPNIRVKREPLDAYEGSDIGNVHNDIHITSTGSGRSAEESVSVAGAKPGDSQVSLRNGCPNSPQMLVKDPETAVGEGSSHVAQHNSSEKSSNQSICPDICIKQKPPDDHEENNLSKARTVSNDTLSAAENSTNADGNIQQTTINFKIKPSSSVAPTAVGDRKANTDISDVNELSDSGNLTSSPFVRIKSETVGDAQLNEIQVIPKDTDHSCESHRNKYQQSLLCSKKLDNDQVLISKIEIAATGNQSKASNQPTSPKLICDKLEPPNNRVNTCEHSTIHNTVCEMVPHGTRSADEIYHDTHDGRQKAGRETDDGCVSCDHSMMTVAKDNDGNSGTSKKTNGTSVANIPQDAKNYTNESSLLLHPVERSKSFEDDNSMQTLFIPTTPTLKVETTPTAMPKALGTEKLDLLKYLYEKEEFNKSDIKECFEYLNEKYPEKERFSLFYCPVSSVTVTIEDNVIPNCSVDRTATDISPIPTEESQELGNTSAIPVSSTPAMPFNPESDNAPLQKISSTHPVADPALSCGELLKIIKNASLLTNDVSSVLSNLNSLSVALTRNDETISDYPSVVSGKQQQNHQPDFVAIHVYSEGTETAFSASLNQDIQNHSKETLISCQKTASSTKDPCSPPRKTRVHDPTSSHNTMATAMHKLRAPISTIISDGQKHSSAIVDNRKKRKISMEGLYESSLTFSSRDRRMRKSNILNRVPLGYEVGKEILSYNHAYPSVVSDTNQPVSVTTRKYYEGTETTLSASVSQDTQKHSIETINSCQSAAPSKKDPCSEWRKSFEGRKGNEAFVHKSLHKSVGKTFIQTCDLPSLVLEWNPSWLLTQEEKRECAPICDSFEPVKDTYGSHLEYYNTYFPLHLLSIWLMMSDARKNSSSVHECVYESQVERVDSVNFTCHVILSIKDVPHWPKQDDIVLVTISDSDTATMQLFGHVTLVMHRDSNPPPHSGQDWEQGIWKKVKFDFLCVEPLRLQVNDIVKVQILCNLRVALIQNSALQCLNHSLKAVVLNPQKHLSRIEVVDIASRSSIDAFQKCIDRILNSTRHPEPRITLVVTSSPCDTIITILDIVHHLSGSNTAVLICVNDKAFFQKLADRLKEYNLVLAVKSRHLKFPDELKRFVLGNRRVTKRDFLLKAPVVLTKFSCFYLGEMAEVLSERNTTWIVNDAHLCTETKTTLPFYYNARNLILMGRDEERKGMHHILKRFGYNVSLFSRLWRAKSMGSDALTTLI